MDYKVLITTSGTGSRLGGIPQHTNPVLVRVGRKPALAHIIDAYPSEVESVITLGHFGQQVKDFVKLAYPTRKFAFVEVDKYQGPGSSLGYSMLKAKDYLQCPFVFHASDTIVKEPVLPPSSNWSGGFKGNDSAIYSSFQVNDNYIKEIKNKGNLDFDYIHIGLVGVHDYQEFWSHLERLYLADLNDGSLNDCRVINEMIKNGKEFVVRPFETWHDIGNTESLEHAREYFSDGIPVNSKDHISKILEEIDFVLGKIDIGQTERLAQAVLNAQTIVACGAGRVGMAVRGFTMRLGHLGLRAFTLGDSVVPAIGQDDLFLVASGSGETQTIYDLVTLAKDRGARIALVTANPESRMGKLADIVVVIPAPSKTKPIDGFRSIQPMTTLNEQCLGIFFDAIVLRLMLETGEMHETMWSRHSNLE